MDTGFRRYDGSLVSIRQPEAQEQIQKKTLPKRLRHSRFRGESSDTLTLTSTVYASVIAVCAGRPAESRSLQERGHRLDY